jgi:hypothetical protein
MCGDQINLLPLFSDFDSHTQECTLSQRLLKRIIRKGEVIITNYFY